eukprot:TRINITY_DN474_c0_g1_i3.p1 TRINITY_DN474_c0_g1~~TRINITY_DN474_c0_g1_i3.p1  ORF type:complete len:504 (-),score=133.30 TRINITY_DN474_c0_g1_i3:868-2379(-)
MPHHGLMRFIRGLLCLLAIFATTAATMVSGAEPAADKPEPEETWMVVVLGGQRIGYIYSLIETVNQDGKQIIRTSNQTSMTIKRFGQSLVMKQTMATEETPDGDMLKFTYESANPPAASSLTTGIIEGDQLKIQSTVNGKTKETKQAWRKEVKSPTFQDRAMQKSPLKPGETRSFEAFMPDFNKVATIKLKATDFQETKLLDGTLSKLLKVDMTQSLIPGLVVSEFVDTKGTALKVSTSMLGAEMITYTVSKEEALKAISGAEFDLAVGTLVKVKRIADPFTRPKLRYRVTIKGQNPETSLVNDETQAVKKIGDDIAEVTVTAMPIPEKATIRPVAKEYVQESQFIQSDDERVIDHANKAAGDAKDPAVIARQMEKYVHDKLVKKNFSTAMASAGEVAKSLEGDCTEHSVLLAAMLRAKGIPSRVVVGLVYVESLSAFGGHMWVEANLDGKWIPMDATMGRERVGPNYLKLATSSLTDDGPSALSTFAPLMLIIGQLQMEVIE